MLGRAVLTMVWSRAASRRVRCRPHKVSASRTREAVTFFEVRGVSVISLPWLPVLSVVHLWTEYLQPVSITASKFRSLD
jgi:hypothetical protein